MSMIFNEDVCCLGLQLEEKHNSKKTGNHIGVGNYEKNKKHYQIGLNIILCLCLIPIIYLVIKAITLVGSYESFGYVFDCLSLEEPWSVSCAFSAVFFWVFILLIMGGWIYYLILGLIALYLTKNTMLKKQKQKLKKIKDVLEIQGELNILSY